MNFLKCVSALHQRASEWFHISPDGLQITPAWHKILPELLWNTASMTSDHAIMVPDKSGIASDGPILVIIYPEGIQLNAISFCATLYWLRRTSEWVQIIAGWLWDAAECRRIVSKWFRSTCDHFGITKKGICLPQECYHLITCWLQSDLE